MKRFKEINLEAGMPTSDDALKLLKSSIANRCCDFILLEEKCNNY